MPSELDRRFDAVLAAVTGPGGRVVVGRDDRGQQIVTNFPATLPTFFRTFCALNAANEALVCGEERFTFADLDRISEQLAQGLAARGITAGDRIGIAMRNCPSWVLTFMAIAKAGGVATLLNGCARARSRPPPHHSQARDRGLGSGPARAGIGQRGRGSRAGSRSSG